MKKARIEHGGRISVKFNNSHLPDGCQNGTRWHRVFVPTYIRFVASYNNPWTVIDTDAVRAMQVIWNKVYDQPKIVCQIETHEAVYSVVCHS